jgi:hypothetical protein
MSMVGEIIAKIRTQQIGATTKKALIVEGPDDVRFFEALLDRYNPEWGQSWVVAPATGKSRVLDILATEPDWLGVVDKDEWTAVEVSDAAAAYPNLFVLPRFCAESYLIEPSEIWGALPAKQREKIEGGQAQLQAEIEQTLDAWKRHAALWHVIHPIYRHMRSSDHRDSLLDPAAVPDANMLASVIATWLQKFDSAKISHEVATRTGLYAQIPSTDLYCQHLYAKKFYPMVVHGVMNKLLGQRTEKERRQALLRTMVLPADLVPLWHKMGM